MSLLPNSIFISPVRYRITTILSIHDLIDGHFPDPSLSDAEASEACAHAVFIAAMLCKCDKRRSKTLQCEDMIHSTYSSTTVRLYLAYMP